MPQLSSTAIRRAAAVAVTAAVAASLTACSSGSGSSGKEPQTITFATNPANANDTYLSSAAAAFEKLHKGVAITIQKLPSESYDSAIATRVQGGNAPDVFVAQSGTGTADSVQTFAKAGYLLKLTDPAIKGYLNPAGADQWEYNGGVYGVSTGSSVNGIVFNADLASQNGITLGADSTFADVLTACKTATAKGKALFGLAGSVPVNPGLLAVELATSTVYGDDPNWNTERLAGKTTFASTQGWKDALNAASQLYKTGCFQKGALGAGFDALSTGTSQGTIFGFFAPSGAAVSIGQASGGHVKLVALPFPNPTGGATYAQVSSEISVVGSAKTKSPKLVAGFLEYLASPAGQKVLTSYSGGFPIGTKNAADLAPAYKPVASYIIDQKYRNDPYLGWPNPKVYNDLGTGVQGLLNGQQTAEQVLKQMDSDWG